MGGVQDTGPDEEEVPEGHHLVLRGAARVGRAPACVALGEGASERAPPSGSASGSGASIPGCACPSFPPSAPPDARRCPGSQGARARAASAAPSLPANCSPRGVNNLVFFLAVQALGGGESGGHPRHPRHAEDAPEPRDRAAARHEQVPAAPGGDGARLHPQDSLPAVWLGPDRVHLSASACARESARERACVCAHARV